MDLNGMLAVLGSGPQVLSGVGPATDGGEEGENKQWVLKFANGVKIQSDTVTVSAASTDETIALPSQYTEEHYTVMVTIAEEPSDAADLFCCGYVPASDRLLYVAIQNNNANAIKYTYISIGKDLT